jgi:glycosyltransferase involved in cell wall biosynthesis
MFDVRSSLNRKNPQGAVQAFMEFAKDKNDVFLILKINRWQGSDPKLLTWLPKSPKIKIITDTLTPVELSQLYAASNCYLSLHRSEGFGRTLVEALQHGLWLITTNYSGPADYLNDMNAKLVSWQPRGVMPGDYPLATYSTWAEPSISEATHALESIYQNEFALGEKNTAGIRTGAQFTLAALANKYKPVLMSYLSDT